MEQAVKHGANSYLAKPFIPEDLLQKIEEALHTSDQAPA